MMATFVYNRGDELPGVNLPWQEETAQNVWTDLNLSSGYTFTVTFIARTTGTESTPACTKNGYNGGVTIDWTAGALDITPDVYSLKLIARETATSKDRTYNPGNLPTVQIR